MVPHHPPSFFFFFNDTATTEIYTLSLHDALPISCVLLNMRQPGVEVRPLKQITGSSLFSEVFMTNARDRKSTRLNSSHLVISYAVFCLKKKKNNKNSQCEICNRNCTPSRLCSHVR